jgi:non-heme chloroperoxidase
MASIALRKPAKKNRAVALTAEQFRYGFGNAVSAGESDELYERWTIPSPGKPLFEAAFANLSPRSPAKVNTDNATRGPLLLTAGGLDRTIPRPVIKSTLKQYRKSPAVTDYKEFPDRGHTLALDSGWREVADTVMNWIKGHSL